MNIQRYTYGTILFIAIVFILKIGKSVLMPITLAFIGWFIIKEIIFYIDKLKFKGRSLPKFLQNGIALTIVSATFILFSFVLTKNADLLQDKIPDYQSNILQMINDLHLPVKLDYKKWLNDILATFDISIFIKYGINSITSIFSNIVLIILYIIFIFLESSTFTTKIQKLYANSRDLSSANEIIGKINHSLSQYITLKTFTSFLTGLLSYIVLTIVGVDFAFFWAYLIFLLNYIPTIGSLVATVFPVIIALVQFGTWQQPTIVLIAVGGIQTFVGNFLEPKLMGNSLNVSPLVVLISLAVGSWIWGVVGMIISVPIIIMLVIICSKFKSLKWIAILLSEKGELPN